MDYESIVLSTEIPNLEFERGGREFSLPVKVKNESGADLLSTRRVYLTYHVLDIDNNVLRWDSERTEVSVSSGKEEIINLVGCIPSEAGEYFFEIDMVKEGVEWFSAQGMKTIIIPVKVKRKGSKYRGLLEERIQKQNETEKILKNILLSGEYTFERPYVQLNPYGNSPLTAMILFRTERPMCISVKISGKTPEADVEGTLPEFTTEHVIPIYGLYPDFLNTVTLSGGTKEGKQEEKILHIQTAPLEENFSAMNLCTYIGDASRYEPGVNFSYTGLEDTGMKYAYDIHGDIRWYFPEIFAEPANYKSSTSIWVVKQAKDAQTLVEGVIYEYSLLGRLISAVVIPYKVHHEIYFTLRKTIFLLTHDTGGVLYVMHR